jgi:hypothetical protein
VEIYPFHIAMQSSTQGFMLMAPGFADFTVQFIQFSISDEGFSILQNFTFRDENIRVSNVAFLTYYEGYTFDPQITSTETTLKWKAFGAEFEEQIQVSSDTGLYWNIDLMGDFIIATCNNWRAFSLLKMERRDTTIAVNTIVRIACKVYHVAPYVDHKNNIMYFFCADQPTGVVAVNITTMTNSIVLPNIKVSLLLPPIFARQQTLVLFMIQNGTGNKICKFF